MGASSSLLSTDDLAHLQQGTSFSLKELEALYKRFESLDRDKSGTLSAEEVLAIPEFTMNPLTPRLLEVFGLSGSGELDFTGFVSILSLFHVKASREDRLRLVFEVFNLAGDGQIKKTEVFQVLRLMSGQSLLDDELAAIVDQTFAVSDLNKDGAIDFEEFSKCFKDSNVLKSMNIAF